MKKILIVEPDNELGKQYQSLVIGQGYQAKLAQSSDDALSLIDSYSPDVVVLELQMIEHNGLELLYELRSYVDWDDIKIVLNTSVKQSLLKKSPVYSRLNIAKYLYKPDTPPSKLLSAIESVVSS